MAIQRATTITGISHTDAMDEPVARSRPTSTATANTTLNSVLRLLITFSIGFMVGSISSINLLASINYTRRSKMTAKRKDVRAMVAALFATNAALDRARRQKKGASTLSLLQIVAVDPGIRPTEIAIAQDVHPSQVTRQVRELESAGLLRVTADLADRRSCRVTLTSAGAEEWERLTEEGLDRFASFVADWEPEEVQTLTLLLEKLEASKAAVTAQQRPPAGRRWAVTAPD
jgi:DNA-binding MarR family transcriptional regulator